MSRDGPHTSIKKIVFVEIFVKDFLAVHNSKREKKSLSSSDFITVAGMVQQFAKTESFDIRAAGNFCWRTESSAWLHPRVRFARPLWLIYTSHSPYCHYCTD